MSDVAQILGLSAGGSSSSAAAGGADAVAKELETLKPTGGGSAGNALRTKAKKPKKLTGMQREVLELLESNHRVNHALYPGVNKMTLQQKWKERKDRPAVKWLRKSFQNPARAELAGEQEHQGGLTLTHWVKAHIDPPDYVFARFNVKCDVLKYSDEEYDAVVANHVDPVMKWSKEETDALFELCERHDLRWIIIADRYNLHTVAKSTPRTVEDIKYRYYEVARLVSEHRDRTEDAADAASSTTATDTVKTEETTTDTATDGASTTTTETPATTPVEPTPVVSSTPVPTSTTEDATPSKYYRFNIVYEKQRKRQLDLGFNRSAEEENEVKKLSDELRLVEQQLKKVAVKVDTKKKKELSDVPFQIQREYPKGVFLRSQMLALPSQQQKNTAISAKMLKKLELMLEEMGVPQRPMPTKLTCEMFDTLRQDVIGLLSLRKHIASKQADAAALKERYHALTGLEYKSTTVVLPSHKTVRRPDLAANTAATTGAGLEGTAAAQISKGKSLKAAEKQFRVSSKRRGSSAAPGTASKRNKKNL